MPALMTNRTLFRASSNGTGAFTVSSAITGYMTPAQAGAANGAGTVTPNISTGDGITPRLTTSTTITLD